MPAQPLNDEQKADAQRLKAIFLREKNLHPEMTQATLAEYCGWNTQATVSQYMNGKIPLNLPALCKFSEALEVAPEEISPSLASQMIITPATQALAKLKLLSLSPNSQAQSQRTQSLVTARHPDDALPDDMIEVMEYQVSFSAGNGHTPNYELIEEREPATYRMSWFQRERINPEHARRFKVTGDSMEPFLYSGDTVLINLAENDVTRIIDGKVYAIRYGDELRVKRLFRQLNGTLTLRSENPSYKDEDVPAEIAQEHITIIGRVRDKSGSGGL